MPHLLVRPPPALLRGLLVAGSSSQLILGSQEAYRFTYTKLVCGRNFWRYISGSFVPWSPQLGGRDTVPTSLSSEHPASHSASEMGSRGGSC